ncbi:collectrin isoform X3 [Camelus bactrianus]|uniref:Collectrin isoform X3 n=1 Tax=Camelus bactrianus TaxID=9837 RepID=A0A9W3FI55_CAMBA|nr:collectrin isoform X3 [Camelus bactrianus]
MLAPPLASAWAHPSLELDHCRALKSGKVTPPRSRFKVTHQILWRSSVPTGLRKKTRAHVIAPGKSPCSDSAATMRQNNSITQETQEGPRLRKYAWDTNEEYLFKAMVAFSMRKVPNRETTEISHVLLCNVTQRVSFWFVVTDPSKNHTLPAVEIQSAIRMNRNRINNAFFLNDQTLEFLRIPSTLAPPTDPPVPIWIIIFGVIFCIVIVATMLLILSGIQQHRRKNEGPSEMEDTEDKCENTITIENGIPCDPLDMKGGHINDAFMTEDERLTPL